MPTALLLLWSAQLGVWPPPQHAVTGSELAALAPGFAAGLRAQPSSARLERALARFNARVAPPQLATARGAAARRAAACGGAVLQHLDVVVGDLSEALGVGTDGSYNLRVRGGANATMSAPTIYGAMHGLETFAQLVEAAAVPAELDVADAPDHGWRGLLVDVGRRFAPPPLLRNIIDTMAAVKLNVLHLHLSDFCRFGVQSLRFPALTAALGAGTPDAGFYTQEEVRALVAYGADRGVRIVPEFEVPGHALGMAPIASVGGLEFCSTCAYGPTGDGTVLTCRPSQLWGTNGTVAVLKSLLGEMAALFDDEVFHIGADETFVKASADERCTPNTTAQLEKQVVEAVARDFGKVPAGWEQVLFETGAATDDTIIYAYMSGGGRVTAAKHRAVVANGSALYLTAAVPGGPAGWAPLYYDIGFDVPSAGAERALLLGGEMSMWTDTYCSPRECGAMPAYHTEKGGALYNRSRDAAYAKSLGGMIWPRGFVGAAAFWNWNSSADARSDEFAASIWALNDALAARGALVCPSNCTCDQMSACGEPYA